MGNYVELVIAFMFKSDVPQEVIRYIRYLYEPLDLIIDVDLKIFLSTPYLKQVGKVYWVMLVDTF
jgi:hypothetical protein